MSHGEISRKNAEWNFHLLKTVNVEQPSEKGRHALTPHQSQPARVPTGDIVEAHGAADFADLLQVRAAGIGSGHYGAGAHARDDVILDHIAAQDFPDEQVLQNEVELAT